MSEESQTPGSNATARSEAVRRAGAAAQGGFELRAELGRGSSGTVHRAVLLRPYGELPAGHEVAIKFLRHDLHDDEKAVGRFRAEGDVGRSLRHDNLAAIHGAETALVGGVEVTYLVMQFIAGRTLGQFLGEGERLVEDLVRRLGADAAAGLAALHRRGLVHRDIKPENLILTPDRQLKIVDLGLVRPFGALGAGSGTSPGASPGASSGWGLAGSVAYAAPEALRGARSGPRSDLYSLGVVLYELCTGQHPFADYPGADEMLDAHLYRAPPPPAYLRPGVSPFLAQILLDLLQKDPDQRPRDAAELQRILTQGEGSDWWQRLEANEPVRASRRRLLRLRRSIHTPFFGRRLEIARLDAALVSTRAGHGAVVAIVGPSGSGRRRLCDHVIDRWLQHEQPPQLLGGEADRELGHAEPFAGALLDLLLRGEGADSPQAEARATAAATARWQLSADDALATARVALGASAEAPEVRADRIATALLTLPARDRPLVLRVDYAERLDTSGRLVLQRLQAATAEQPLLVLLTGDVDELELEPTLRIELSGIDEDEFVAFAHDLFRDGEVEDGFVLAAHQTMSGVPGNLIEALDHLVQQGDLRGQPGDYHDLRPGLDLRPAPNHLRRFQDRIATLDEEARAVLSAAAVLGRRCLLSDLLQLLDRSELAVLETLSLFRGRIVRAQGGEVSFRHPDFLGVLLDSIAPAERQRLHRRAAEQFAARGRRALEIGMHYSQALDHRDCIEPLLDGLDELVRAGSRRTSLRIAGRLGVHFGHLEQDDATDRQRLRWHLLHAAARRNAGQLNAAARSFRAAEALGRRLDDRVGSATARIGIADRELTDGHLMAAIARLEGVHDDLATDTGADADHTAAQAHGLHGRILLYRGQAVEGHRHLQAALRRLPAGRDELRAHLLIDLARLEALQHHYPTALKTLRRLDQLPAARKLPRVALRLHLYRGQIRAMLGDDEAAQDLRTASDEAERLGLPEYGARAALYLGERQFWRGQDEQARIWFTRSRSLAKAGDERLGETMSRCYLFGLGGDDDELEADVERLALPSVSANLLLARAARGAASAVDRELLDALTAGAELPLSLHLRALLLAERPASARSLVRSIAQRIPDRRDRRRFMLLWPAGARI